MIIKEIPSLLDKEIKSHFDLAANSEKRRSHKILHEKGDYHNEVFNFMIEGCYMQPHLHPAEEKIEKMYLIRGSFALILFNNDGKVKESIILEEGKKDFIEVPAFTWHTYCILSDKVIIYETMEGFYEPNTWRTLASWAPEESSRQSLQYIESLTEQIRRKT